MSELDPTLRCIREILSQGGVRLERGLPLTVLCVPAAFADGIAEIFQHARPVTPTKLMERGRSRNRPSQHISPPLEYALYRLAQDIPWQIARSRALRKAGEYIIRFRQQFSAFGDCFARCLNKIGLAFIEGG